MKRVNQLSKEEMRKVMGGVVGGCNASVDCPGGGSKSCSCSQGSCSSSGGSVSCSCALTEETSVDVSLSC
ncbi:hypothetical protein [Pedobacter sp.]|uniref:hypothetical protein n=1 Tax=Pedobacter sp. TaxID=1411316 RepID=UPI0031D622BD